MPIKVILFNGPPGSGKTTCADKMAQLLTPPSSPVVTAYRYNFASSLKDATHRVYGLDAWEDDYAHNKETPNEDFFGLSPRQAYITVSEDMIKPVLGKDHFGKVFVRFVKELPKSEEDIVIVIGDCGFTEEVVPIVEYLGKENITIVQVERTGCDYRNDSRKGINIEGVKGYKILNNFTLDSLTTRLETLIKEIL